MRREDEDPPHLGREGIACLSRLAEHRPDGLVAGEVEPFVRDRLVRLGYAALTPTDTAWLCITEDGIRRWEAEAESAREREAEQERRADIRRRVATGSGGRYAPPLTSFDAESAGVLPSLRAESGPLTTAYRQPGGAGRILLPVLAIGGGIALLAMTALSWVDSPAPRVRNQLNPDTTAMLHGDDGNLAAVPGAPPSLAPPVQQVTVATAAPDSAPADSMQPALSGSSPSLDPSQDESGAPTMMPSAPYMKPGGLIPSLTATASAPVPASTAVAATTSAWPPQHRTVRTAEDRAKGKFNEQDRKDVNWLNVLSLRAAHRGEVFTPRTLPP